MQEEPRLHQGNRRSQLCNSDVWCDRYGGGQVWVLGTGVVTKKGIKVEGGVQEEAVCYLTEAQDWEELTLEWIGLGWILF